MSKKGFTLVELMVVIAVIGILASVALVSLTGVQRSARDAQRKSDLATYRTALERYYADNQVYPGSASTTAPDTTVSSTGIFTAGGALVTNNYLPKALLDPQNNVSSCKKDTASAVQACLYKFQANATTNTATSYVLWTVLENPTTAGGIFYIDAKGQSGIDGNDTRTVP